MSRFGGQEFIKAISAIINKKGTINKESE